MRRAMIEAGVYFFPVATKQCSISAAHSPGGHRPHTLEALDGGPRDGLRPLSRDGVFPENSKALESGVHLDEETV